MTSRRLAATCVICAVALAPVAFGQTEPAPGAVPFDLNDPHVQSEARKLAKEPAAAPPSGHQLRDDRTGRRQTGKASIYSSALQGRKTASGRIFRQDGEAAASKTLPLGTVAKVTNTETGRTATVVVEDRGPFVDGRTVDLSKATAAKIGLDPHAGVAPVVVAPVAVPQPDGGVKPGAGALPGPATAKPDAQ